MKEKGIEMFDLKYIENKWDELSVSNKSESWDILNRNYSESHRAYHTWEHIENMLRKLDVLKNQTVQFDLIATAIFWHDSIYKTQLPDGNCQKDSINVFESCQLFLQNNKFETNWEVSVVENMIIGTADHLNAKPKLDYYDGFLTDFNLFIDLDLCGLGAEWEQFSTNTTNIRKEFSFVSDVEFNKNRKEFLNKFFQKTPLFRSPISQLLWENQAKKNLLKEINTIRT
jgi:predicted metal-dependent HD superfamily phosphohydrolase